MTIRIPARPRPAMVPSRGCATDACGGQPVVMDGVNGRRCTDHATLLPILADFPYRPALAEDMVDVGRPDAAFDYLLVWLRAETERRFDAARWHLDPVIATGTITAARIEAAVIFR